MSLALNPSLYDGLGVSQNDVRPRPTHYSTSTHFSLSFVLQSVACKFPRGVGSTKPSSIVHGPLVRPSSDGSFDCLNLSHQKPLVSSSSGRSLALTVGSKERRRARRGGGLAPSLPPYAAEECAGDTRGERRDDSGKGIKSQMG